MLRPHAVTCAIMKRFCVVRSAQAAFARQGTDVLPLQRPSDPADTICAGADNDTCPFTTSLKVPYVLLLGRPTSRATGWQGSKSGG